MLRRLLTPKQYRPEPNVCGLTELRPVKTAYREHVLNKAGRVVLTGLLDGRRVKVYEAATGPHAAFIADVAKTSVGRHLHQVLGVRGNIVIAEWVDGISSPACDLAGIARIQTEFHQMQFPAGNVNFDYWFDLILPRFQRAAHLLGEGDLAATVSDRVSVLWQTSSVLMHPDVTPANLIRTSGERLVLVDNELLSRGGIPELDVCNTVYALPKQNRRAYVEHYAKLAKRKLDDQQIETLNGAWFARRLGSLFVQGQIGEAARLTTAFKSGKQALPAAISLLQSTGS